LRRQNKITEAQARLGWCYQTGTGTPRDMDRALTWYYVASAAGNAAAQFSLGDIYVRGTDVLSTSMRRYVTGKNPPNRVVREYK